MTDGGCVGVPAGGGCGLIIPHSWGSLGSRIKFEGQIRWSKPEKKTLSSLTGAGTQGNHGVLLIRILRLLRLLSLFHYSGLLPFR